MTLNYTTKENDTFSSIAWKMYGSLSGIQTIIENNPLVPIDGILPINTILVIPIIEDSEIITTSNVPWK